MRAVQVSKEEVGYAKATARVDPRKPSGIFCCATCVKFKPPDACTTVRGTIRPADCCNGRENDELATIKE